MNIEQDPRLIEALHHYYADQTIAKLELLARMSTHTRFARFHQIVPLLGWCAFLLWEVDQASQLPLQGPSDLPAWLTQFDQARVHLRALLIDLFPKGPYGYADPTNRYQEWLDARFYVLSDHFQQRLGKIHSRGKYPLWQRLAMRRAER